MTVREYKPGPEHYAMLEHIDLASPDELCIWLSNIAEWFDINGMDYNARILRRAERMILDNDSTRVDSSVKYVETERASYDARSES